MGLYSKSHIERNSATDQPVFSTEFGDMMKGDGPSSPQPVRSTSSSVSNTPPTTPLTPGTPLSGPGTPITPSGSLASLLPLGPPTTPSYPGPYRHRLPSFTESDSQSSTRDTLSDDGASQSDSQSDVASVSSSSTAEWTNFDITPLVKKELKDAIMSRRKTRGLPDVKVDFSPRLPDKLTPEEEERRLHQKERNRDAASKCRSKKRNAVGRLVEEAQQLETENDKLREEMKALESERSQLRFLLDMHSPKCMIQQASSPMNNTSSGIQIADLSNESVPPLIHSPTNEVPMLTDTVTAEAGAPTPLIRSTSSYGSSCYPPTPSTTHSSLSCTEPSTPLTPTASITDAPLFPTMSSNTIPMSAITDLLLQDTPTSVLPITSLANSFTCTLTDAFSMSDSADFHPEAPPTPELLDDHDGPLSESFVKRYLGMDTFLADLSLPTIADNPNVPDSFISSGSAPGNAQISNETSLQESGGTTELSSEKVNPDGYTVHTQPRFDSQFPQTSVQVERERMNSPTRSHDPTPDTPVTLSLSALLGISFDGIDETADDAASFSVYSHSAIGL